MELLQLKQGSLNMNSWGVAQNMSKIYVGIVYNVVNSYIFVV